MRVFIILSLFAIIIHAKEPNFFLWSKTDGTSVVVLEGGIVKPVYTIWAGYAAWNNETQVANAISQHIQRGYIPYVFSYQFGDNGLKGNYQKAVDFDAAIAKVIGNSFAIVNLETEWDALMSIMKSKDGQKAFIDRIDVFRRYSRNAVLTSSPGLWKSDSEYLWFKTISDKLDLYGHLEHAVNDSSFCTRRANGSYYEGGKSLDQAKEVYYTLLNKRAKTVRLWGQQKRKHITADLAITSCGWGKQGQAAVLDNLVKNFDALYTLGWRGALIRNYAPSSAERYMGVENEGGFVFNDHSLVTQKIKQGLDKAIDLIKNGSSKEPEIIFSVKKHVNSNEYWMQLQISPSDLASKVEVILNGSWKTLHKESWGDWTLAGNYIPNGIQLKIKISDTLGKISEYNLNW